MRFLFEQYTLDTSRRELRRASELVPLEPQVFDLLEYLVKNRDHVVTKDDLIADVWRGRIVSDSTLSTRINGARTAIGDTGEQQRLIRTLPRKGVRFVGEVREELSGPGSRDSSPPAAMREPAARIASPRQEVTFCRTADGVNLAVATTGDGPALVKTANWLTHVEHDWQSPIWSPLFSRLSQHFRLVRYDERGSGMSSWDVADLTFDAFVHDLEQLIDALKLHRFALFGISRGAAVAIAYAAKHPDRVSRLVLQGGYALGWRLRSSPEQLAQRDALLTLFRHGWENPAFRQAYTSLFIPDATLEQMRWFNDLQTTSASPANAVRLLNAFGEINVTELVPLVKAPTLLLHSRGDAVVPFESGVKLAQTIPGARFVALDSRNHLILPQEPAWDRYLDEICSFLTIKDTQIAAS